MTVLEFLTTDSRLSLGILFAGMDTIDEMSVVLSGGSRGLWESN